MDPAAPLRAYDRVGAQAPPHYRKITLERVEKLIDPVYWADVNVRSRLYDESSKVPLDLQVFHLPMGHKSTWNLFQQAIEQGATKAEKATVGDEFGPTWSTHWFEVRAVIPDGFRGKEVHMRFDTNSEAMVWSADGEPLQGLTGGEGDGKRVEFVVSRSAVPGTALHFFIEMAANELFGAGDGGFLHPPSVDRKFKLVQADICVFNTEWAHLFHDLSLLVEIAKKLPESSRRGSEALFTANQVANVLWTDDDSTLYQARQLTAAFFAKRNGEAQFEVSAIGHCHIDTAWLWPYRETRRKCGRSWATAIRYMEDYPEYRFTASQAQQLQWVKEDYPGLFSKLRTSERFVPTGGSWVEMDCNVPSGESFCRQFLYGQRFFKEEFGRPCKVFWLPDTFGYASQLPQLVRAAEMDYFLTQKLSWNLINKFPYSTFYWEGLDGTRVLTHFPPANTYCAKVTVEEVVNTAEQYHERDRSNDALMVFGHGDGGGGPQRGMLERIHRLQDCDGIPKVSCRSPIEFFERLERNIQAPLTWRGELYFELHRGTYTTHARIKKANRRSEFLLRRVELLCAIAVHHGLLQVYPQANIEELWKLILLNQFHDVLPGTSIQLANDDAHHYYEEVERRATALLNSTAAALCGCALDQDDVGDEQTAAAASVAEGAPRKRVRREPTLQSVVLLNANDFPLTTVVEMPLDELKTHTYWDLDEESTRRMVLDTEKQRAFLEVRPDPMSVVSLPEAVTRGSLELNRVLFSWETLPGSSEAIGFVVENQHLCARFTCDGILRALHGKAPDGAIYQVLKQDEDASSCGGNRFWLYEDTPLFWDAWDVMEYHVEKRAYLPPASSCVLSVENQLRVEVLFEYQLTEHSSLKQIVRLDARSRMLVFDTSVNWHEKHKCLKVEFPVAIRSHEARYHTQYGIVSRPTHRNTSWDVAKFEVCGHHWADLSEPGRGVSLLNDCKYGYSVMDQMMSLSLLRSPKRPDPTADMGHHRFQYALFPHQENDPMAAGVSQCGFELNDPPQLIPVPVSLSAPQRLFWLDEAESSPSVRLDCVKAAEGDPQRALIVRLYESHGGQARATLRSVFPFRSVVQVNILENPLEHGTATQKIEHLSV
eukprot:CAMPEP_0174241680 /NCGR_PEP_ID=MMETSP0417-20130205/24362_1 /TAXON_ID=242541 /ORGANISM="Mayorella sp, Strain BSH-02190019" /LENGTH=1107 /DNA_ID=CAMNT_0015320955 /DNA_START=179 /DNA_END=3499 /DNA_ORIENTATION=+